jgi:hypothetical protein
VTEIYADIEALKGLRETLARFRYDQRDARYRGEGEIEVTRGELEARASSALAWLERCRVELDACREASASSGASGASGASASSASSASSDDCSGCERAVAEAQERLEHVRRWQQRVEQEAGVFYGAAMRFRDLLENDLPQTEDRLLDMITSLEAARRVQAAGS